MSKEIEQRLKDKYDLYKQELKKRHLDYHGFLEENCDAILFSALIAQDEDLSFDIFAAYDGKYFHRRPVDENGRTHCYDENHPRNLMTFTERFIEAKNQLPSIIDQVIKEKGKVDLYEIFMEFYELTQQKGSTISKDMMNGIMWYCWKYKRLDIIELILANGSKQGYGSPDKTRMPLPMKAAFAWMSYKLGGPCRFWLFPFWIEVGGVQTGYRAHLQMINLHLKTETGYPLLPHEKSIIQKQANRCGWNPLFLTIAGRLEEAMLALDNDNLFPQGRLPRTSDRKARWVIQRDKQSDLNPLPKTDVAYGVEHHGGDYVFAYCLYNHVKNRS